MGLEHYLRDRWNNLSPETKRILDLNNPEMLIFIKCLWTKQYYEELIEKNP